MKKNIIFHADRQSLKVLILGKLVSTVCIVVQCLTGFTFQTDIFTYSILLPTGSEEKGVLEVGSIPDAILPSRQYMTTIAL